VSKIVRLGTLFPEDLNLNGDQANLLVLRKRLELRGVECLIQTAKPDQLDGYGLLFLGHGSKGAWAELSASQPELISNFLNANAAVKFVAGNGVEKVLEVSGNLVRQSSWSSEFVSQDGVVGYLNDDLAGPVFTYESTPKGITVLSRLHGPILAKNPTIADKIIFDAGWAQESSSAELDKLDQLAELSRKTAFEH
jgi:CobQ-like glutamine amidotransferase family enzyme